MNTVASRTISIEDAKARWNELIAQVQAGEEWLIVNPAGEIVAKLEPIPGKILPEVRRWQAFGMMKGQITLAPDFDAPLEDFKPYTE